MSTMVQIPVRVKPPPAETGEIISPGCASFDTAMPLNGARMTVSAMSVCRKATCCSATLTSWRAAWRRARSASTCAVAVSMSASGTMPSFTRRC